MNIVLIDNYSQNGKTEVIEISLFIIVLLLCITSVFLYFNYSHSKIVNQMVVDKVNVQLEYFEQMRGSQEVLRGYRHDRKNHIQVVKSLLEQNKIDEAKEYLDLLDNSTLSVILVDTGNSVLDLILSEKIYQMQKLDFELEYDIHIPPDGKLQLLDVVQLFGNLFDNAVESLLECRKMGRETVVRFQLTEKKGNLIFHMINSTITRQLERNAWLPTSKSDREHGFGMKSIKRTVKAYQGQYDYWVEKNRFYTELVLMNIWDKDEIL